VPMKNDITRFLKQEKAPDVFFTTMIDLYAIHPDFPGLAESESMRQDPLQRVEFLEQRFAEDIGDVGSFLIFSYMNMKHTSFLPQSVLNILMLDGQKRLKLSKLSLVNMRHLSQSTMGRKQHLASVSSRTFLITEKQNLFLDHN
jgi:hypothetical protein